MVINHTTSVSTSQPNTPNRSSSAWSATPPPKPKPLLRALPPNAPCTSYSFSASLATISRALLGTSPILTLTTRTSQDRSKRRLGCGFRSARVSRPRGSDAWSHRLTGPQCVYCWERCGRGTGDSLELAHSPLRGKVGGRGHMRPAVYAGWVGAGGAEVWTARRRGYIGCGCVARGCGDAATL